MECLVAMELGRFLEGMVERLDLVVLEGETNLRRGWVVLTVEDDGGVRRERDERSGVGGRVGQFMNRAKAKPRSANRLPFLDFYHESSIYGNRSFPLLRVHDRVMNSQKGAG